MMNAIGKFPGFAPDQGPIAVLPFLAGVRVLWTRPLTPRGRRPNLKTPPRRATRLPPVASVGLAATAKHALLN